MSRPSVRPSPQPPTAVWLPSGTHAVPWLRPNALYARLAWYATVGVMLLGALLLRLPTLARESFWRDETDAVIFASAPWPELLHSFTLPQHNGPAYHLLLRLWTDLTGTSEFTVRALSTVADVAALAVIVVIGRRAGSTAVGLLAGALWAVLPATVWYAREGKMYSVLALVSAAVLYLSLTAVERRSPVRGVAAVALAGLGIYVHFFAGLLGPPAVVGLVVALAGSRQHGWRISRAALTVVVAATLVAAVIAVSVLPREWGTLTEQQWTGHPFVSLGELLPRVLFGITLNTPPIAGVFTSAVLVFGVLAGGLAVPGESDRTGWARAALLWSFVLLPLLVFYVVSFHLPLFAERYFVVMLPALVLLVARGLAVVWRQARPVGVVAGLSVAGLLLSVTTQQMHVSTKANYRALGAYLREAARPGDALMVVMPYNVRAVRFYAGNDLPEVPPPFTEPGTAPEQLEAQTGPLLGSYRRLWYVRAEADQYDPDGSIFRWLSLRSRSAATQAWNGVQLDLFDSAPR